MYKSARRTIVFSVILALVLIPLGPALLVEQNSYASPYSSDTNEKPGASAMTFDLVIARPLGIIGTATGAAVLVLSSPFLAIGGKVGEASQHLFIKPVRYTFKRPLGHL